MGNPLENPLEMLENPWEIRVFQIIHDAKGNPMGKFIPRRVTLWIPIVHIYFKEKQKTQWLILDELMKMYKIQYFHHEHEKQYTINYLARPLHLPEKKTFTWFPFHVL